MKISKVTLYVHDLSRMESFYCSKLGFKMLQKSPTSFAVKAGKSILAFEKAHPDEQKQYHFAFNIPSNLFQEAKNWIRALLPLLEEKGQDEVYFERIDAHSFYFYDPEENVVELIARSINPAIDADQFTAEAIQSIGEINLTTDDLVNVGEQLKTLGIPVRNNERLVETSLNFMGDSGGDAYLLLGPSMRTWYFSAKEARVSRIQITINDKIQLNVDEDGNLYY